jgi:CheY-like chemotaxis protein/anti-sigma regulatory factor (Ser/Thr protein kinase)
VGAIEAQRSEFALQPLFDRLEQAFSVAAQAKGLRVRVRRTHARVASDPVLLERILLNLAANAVRYTQEGGLVVAARTRGARVRIEIWDTGIGIAPHEQAHIFEEFYRVGGAANESSLGLGLGLAIVHRLARLLDHHIEVRSIEGRGSVFVVEVPTAFSTAMPVAPVSKPRDGVRFDGLTVLVIDDDPAAREAAAGLLAQWGCETLLASCGTQAEDLLRARSTVPSVILCDYRLGAGELGTEVVQRLRACLREDVPALIVTADASALSKEAVDGAGMHLLRKPLKPANLRAVLHHVLSINRAMA